MSMRNYATEAYGLILSENEAFEAIKKYLEEEGNPIRENEDIWDIWDVGEYIGLNLYSNLEAETFLICDDGTDDGSSSNYIEDSVFILELNKYPSLFSRAYENKEEILTELKSSKIAKYLPEDFDYNDHLRHLVGNSFG